MPRWIKLQEPLLVLKSVRDPYRFSIQSGTALATWDEFDLEKQDMEYSAS